MKCSERLGQSVVDSWYTPKGQGFAWTRSFLPLSWLFSYLAKRSKQKYLAKKRWQPPVPVLVVGNISVGGTGKTPVVAALVEGLRQRGWQPGVISRGFGTKNADYPLVVTTDSKASEMGDEPVMLVRQLQVPLAVDPDRVQAAQYLCKHFPCDIIIADDGLQHYNLQRHIELLVMDGERLLGNELCLPAGPLREAPERMNSVDQILVNGEPRQPVNSKVPCGSFYLTPASLKPVGKAADGLAPKAGKVHAVAGIGNPGRFFKTLDDLGFDVIPHAFADHHAFTREDIDFDDSLPVLMTAKDAVKCQPFADPRHWYLPVTADLPEGTLDHIVTLIQERFETIEPDQGQTGRSGQE